MFNAFGVGIHCCVGRPSDSRTPNASTAGKSTAFQAPFEQTSARFAYLRGGRRGNGAFVRTAIVYRFTSKNYLLIQFPFQQNLTLHRLKALAGYPKGQRHFGKTGTMSMHLPRILISASLSTVLLGLIGCAPTAIVGPAANTVRVTHIAALDSEPDWLKQTWNRCDVLVVGRPPKAASAHYGPTAGT